MRGLWSRKWLLRKKVDKKKAKSKSFIWSLFLDYLKKIINKFTEEIIKKTQERNIPIKNFPVNKNFINKINLIKKTCNENIKSLNGWKNPRKKIEKFSTIKFL